MQLSGAINVPAECVMQQVRLENDLSVTILYGIHDDLNLSHKDDNATFMGKSWMVFLKRTGIKSNEIWPDKTKEKSLLHAKLFTPSISPIWFADVTPSEEHVVKWRASQRYSLIDLRVDMSAVFAWNESFKISYQHKYDSRCSHESTPSRTSFHLHTMQQVEESKDF